MARKKNTKKLFWFREGPNMWVGERVRRVAPKDGIPYVVFRKLSGTRMLNDGNITFPEVALNHLQELPFEFSAEQLKDDTTCASITALVMAQMKDGATL